MPGERKNGNKKKMVSALKVDLDNGNPTLKCRINLMGFYKVIIEYSQFGLSLLQDEILHVAPVVQTGIENNKQSNKNRIITTMLVFRLLKVPLTIFDIDLIQTSGGSKFFLK